MTRLKVVFAWALLASCTRFENDPRQHDPLYFRFEDSLASEVHEISTSESSEGVRWTMLPDPERSYGSESGEDAFGRVTHALLLPDGRMVGADGQRNELLVFDGDGRLEDVWGRQGAGPGEFERLDWVGLCHGVVYAYDGGLDVVHSFELDGTHARTFRPLIPVVSGSAETRFSERVVCNHDGEIGVLSSPFASFGLKEGVELTEGPYRPGVTVAIGNADAGFRFVTEIAGEDRYLFPDGGGTGPWWPVAEAGRRPSVAISENYLFVATGDAYEVAIYGLDGVLEHLIRSEKGGRKPFTRDAIASVRQRLFSKEDDPSRRALLRQTLDNWIWPTHYPAIGGLLVDSEGCLWVMNGHSEERHVRWSVLSSRGELLGVIDLKASFSLMQVAQDQLIGRERDQDEIDYLVVYRFEGGSGRSC